MLSEGDDDGDAAAARTPTARGAPPSRERRAAARLVREVCVVFAARTHSTVSLLTHVAGRGGARRQSSSSLSSSPVNAGASGVSHHQDGGEIEKRTRVFRISWHLGLTLHPAARITAIGSACVRIVVALRRDWPIVCSHGSTRAVAPSRSGAAAPTTSPRSSCSSDAAIVANRGVLGANARSSSAATGSVDERASARPRCISFRAGGAERRKGPSGSVTSFETLPKEATRRAANAAARQGWLGVCGPLWAGKRRKAPSDHEHCARARRETTIEQRATALQRASLGLHHGLH